MLLWKIKEFGFFSGSYRSYWKVLRRGMMWFLCFLKVFFGFRSVVGLEEDKVGSGEISGKF